MATYNSDVRDLIDSIDAMVNVAMRANNWSLFTNGYEKGKNDTYFKGYRQDGKTFPVVVKLTIHAPWSFYEWNGKRTSAIDYNNDLGGGKLEFDGKFHFELSIAPDLFSKTSFYSLNAEYEEFKDVPTEKWTLDLTAKKFKAFTKKDKAAIEKWVMNAGANMRENIQDPIKQQIARRFEEFYEVNPEWAEEYAPQTVKDIFIF